MNLRAFLLVSMIMVFSIAALSFPAAAQDKVGKNQIVIAYTNISSQMMMLSTGLEMYKTDKGAYPQSLSALYPTYLKTPNTVMKDSYFDYTTSKNGGAFTLSFNQGSPPGIKMPSGYPRIDSTKGVVEYLPGITSFSVFIDKICP